MKFNDIKDIHEPIMKMQDIIAILNSEIEMFESFLVYFIL